MVCRRIVEIDRALYQSHAEYAGIEVEVALRIAGDRRDVMDAGRCECHGRWEMTLSLIGKS